VPSPSMIPSLVSNCSLGALAVLAGLSLRTSIQKAFRLEGPEGEHIHIKKSAR
jgi:hypothetical protein